MRKLKQSRQFKKDFKRIQHDPEKLLCLADVLAQLGSTGTVPAKYRPHFLSGKYKGCIECHVQNDFLLIWIDESRELIKLTRLGSHSELF